jgi:hypothetical protein
MRQYYYVVCSTVNSSSSMDHCIACLYCRKSFIIHITCRDSTSTVMCLSRQSSDGPMVRIIPVCQDCPSSRLPSSLNNRDSGVETSPPPSVVETNYQWFYIRPERQRKAVGIVEIGGVSGPGAKWCAVVVVAVVVLLVVVVHDRRQVCYHES